MGQIQFYLKKFNNKFSFENLKLLSGKEFNLQIKMMIFCGVFHSPSLLWKIVGKIIQLVNVFMNVYSIVSLSVFCITNYTKVYDFSECLALIISVVMGLAKYLILIYSSDEVYDMIFKIRKLNEKCMYRS